MSEQKFKPDDRVRWRAGAKWSHYDVFGTVTRVTPKGTVFVVPDAARPGERPLEFRQGSGLFMETASERAHREWNGRQPSTIYARPRRSFGHRDTMAGVVVEALDTPEKARYAAAELLAIADWWESEPGRVCQPGTDPVSDAPQSGES